MMLIIFPRHCLGRTGRNRIYEFPVKGSIPFLRNVIQGVPEKSKDKLNGKEYDRFFVR